MPWRGEIAFADEALAFRRESAENRFHAHAAVQCVHCTLRNDPLSAKYSR